LARASCGLANGLAVVVVVAGESASAIPAEHKPGMTSRIHEAALAATMHVDRDAMLAGGLPGDRIHGDSHFCRFSESH
jgi:hypothetical protein